MLFPKSSYHLLFLHSNLLLLLLLVLLQSIGNDFVWGINTNFLMLAAVIVLKKLCHLQSDPLNYVYFGNGRIFES